MLLINDPCNCLFVFQELLLRLISDTNFLTFCVSVDRNCWCYYYSHQASGHDAE